MILERFAYLISHEHFRRISCLKREEDSSPQRLVTSEFTELPTSQGRLTLKKQEAGYCGGGARMAGKGCWSNSFDLCSQGELPASPGLYVIGASLRHSRHTKSSSVQVLDHGKVMYYNVVVVCVRW